MIDVSGRGSACVPQPLNRNVSLNLSSWRVSTQADAYRQAYNVDAETSNSTINDNFYSLARRTDIAPRIAERRAPMQERALCSAEGINQELKQVRMATVTGDVRPSDEIAALDEMAKILGLYRDDDKNRDTDSVPISKVTVVLDRGHGQTESERHQVADIADRTPDKQYNYPQRHTLIIPSPSTA